MTSDRLSGRTVMAIGCGTPDGQINNGFAAVRGFLDAGARVCIVDREETALRFAVDLAAADGHAADRVTTAVADVTDESALAAAYDHCTGHLGAPTVLYYNVGIVINGGLDSLETSAFRRALDINLSGAFSAMRLALPHLREAGGGSIITVSSVGGMRHMGYDYPAYAASKAGLIELTKAVGNQYAREGIRANSIAPGLIETPLIRGSISGHYAGVEEMLRARHELSPTGRMGTPQDVAALAVFLASDESAYVNATVIPVDGGLTHQIGTAPR